MPYDMQIDRANPGCIIFLVDQSNSMIDGIAGTARPKVETVATAINRFLAELITSCEKGEEKPRNYFDVGLIGYTTDQNGVAIIKPLFQGRWKAATSFPSATCTTTRWRSSSGSGRSSWTTGPAG